VSRYYKFLTVQQRRASHEAMQTTACVRLYIQVVSWTQRAADYYIISLTWYMIRAHWHGYCHEITPLKAGCAYPNPSTDSNAIHTN